MTTPVEMSPVMKMKTRFQPIFDLFKGLDVYIMGSALRDYPNAKDIDVLFLSSKDFQEGCKRLNTTFKEWDSVVGHLKSAKASLPGTFKPLQLVNIDTIKTPQDHRQEVLGRDGKLINPGIYFQKSMSWKYDKTKQVKPTNHVR